MNLTRIALLMSSVGILLFSVDGGKNWREKEWTWQEMLLEEQLTMAASDAVLQSFPLANPEPQIQQEIVYERFQLATRNLTEETGRYPVTLSISENGFYEFEIEDAITGHRVVTGVKCVKKPLYFVMTDGKGNLFYHRENCIHIHDQSWEKKGMEAYYLTEECASRGAYPCPICLP